MENVGGRIAGILAIIAVPILGVAWLRSREPENIAAVEEVAAAAFVPAPLYSGPPQAGLTFESNGRVTDVRGFAHLALFVPSKEAPSTFTKPGPFVATFRGTLRVPTRERFTFTRVGTGELTLQIDGRDVPFGRRLRLKKGEHPFVARFTAQPAGNAWFRVYWECGEFAREPIPVAALRHERSPSLEQFAALRRGRDLSLSLRCGACHVGAPLPNAAPPLGQAGRSLRPAWIAQWLQNPREFRPGSAMPRLVTDSKDAIDIAAFLSTLGRPDPWPEFDDATERRGAELFAGRGCIACHTLPDHADAATTAGRTPLAFVRTKWQPAALIDFLKDPWNHNRATAMPDFGLSDEESRAIAAFLLARDRRVLPEFGVADIDRGRRRAGELGCARCHGLPVENKLVAPQRAITDAGSVDCEVARYELTDADRSALREFLGGRVGFYPVAAEYAETWLEGACADCHGYRGRAPRLASTMAEVAAFRPEDEDGFGRLLPPDLTDAGAKLRRDWLQPWLAGEIPERPRPWLHARMPTFRHLDAERLARGMGHLAGFARTEDPVRPEVPDGAPAIGARLLGKEEGFACVQCHRIGDQAASEVFEAPGIDLKLAPRRLRHEFYLRWMLDPTRVDPGTKMTKFADQDGKTGFTDVLGGDARAQFEAIWRHIESLGR